ncbi:MAG TPA: hypothetical protein VMW56_11455 [Candidatus Margulisiibacteriota bacterium]|nr:hypothetical protein [Candidatus Margulisiibacteriota bacterium]
MREPEDRDGLRLPCGCRSEPIRAVHGYLKEHFPDFALRDFHAPTRLMHAGLPMPHAEHHVISVSREDILPYQAILLCEFQEQAPHDIRAQLQRWDLADALRASRIAIVSKGGVSPL